MSTLRTNAILDASGGTTATVNGYAPTLSNMAGRNRIINGAMTIDQRNAGASVTPSSLYSTYTLDRWNALYTVGSKFSVQQNAGAVTPPAGFKNYLGATSLSAYSPGTGETFSILQGIEGYNVADLGWGAAGAQTITLSFWARSSLTGTFGGALQNSGATRTYPFSYTISAANTWEYKTITVSGDTSGTWLTTNGNGLTIVFSLGSGATNLGTAGAWAGTGYYGAVGQTNLVGTNGATFYLTGVQLEAGSIATPFERRLYGQELALCQRYFYVPTNAPSPIFSLAWVAGAAAFQGGGTPHPQTMRATPTVSGVTSFTIQGVTASAVGFAFSATEQYLYLGSSNSNSQADGALRAVNCNQAPAISAEL